MKNAPPVRIPLRKLFVAMFMGTLLTAGMAFATNTTSAKNGNIDHVIIATGPAIIADTGAVNINTETSTFAIATAQVLVSSTVTNTGALAQQFVSAYSANTGAARFNASDGNRLRGHDPARITVNSNIIGTNTGNTLATANDETAIIDTTNGKAILTTGNAAQTNINTFDAASWHRTSTTINTGAPIDQRGQLASTGGLAIPIA